jgi:hypothetical protein
MCKACDHVLRGCMAPHTVYDCPYRRSFYCCVCATYGHAGTPTDCPNQVAWAIRTGLPPPPGGNRILWAPETEDGVRALLRDHGIMPGTTPKQNRRLLRDLANCMEPPHLLKFKD